MGQLTIIREFHRVEYRGQDQKAVPREVALGLISSEVNKVKMLVAQPCLTLCNPRDCSLPGSSVHGTFQARILEWVAIPFSRGSSQARDQTQVSYIAGTFFTI